MTIMTVVMFVVTTAFLDLDLAGDVRLTASAARMAGNERDE